MRRIHFFSALLGVCVYCACLCRLAYPQSGGVTERPPHRINETVDTNCNYSVQPQDPSPCQPSNNRGCEICADSELPCVGTLRRHNPGPFNEVIAMPPGSGSPVETWDELCWYERRCTSMPYDFARCVLAPIAACVNHNDFTYCRECVGGLYTTWSYRSSAQILPCESGS